MNYKKKKENREHTHASCPFLAAPSRHQNERKRRSLSVRKKEKGWWRFSQRESKGMSNGCCPRRNQQLPVSSALSLHGGGTRKKRESRPRQAPFTSSRSSLRKNRDGATPHLPGPSGRRHHRSACFCPHHQRFAESTLYTSNFARLPQCPPFSASPKRLHLKTYPGNF